MAKLLVFLHMRLIDYHVAKQRVLIFTSTVSRKDKNVTHAGAVNVSTSSTKTVKKSLIPDLELQPQIIYAMFTTFFKDTDFKLNLRDNILL